MSKLIRSEFARISKERRLDIKNAFIERLESLAESEEQVECGKLALFNRMRLDIGPLAEVCSRNQKHHQLKPLAHFIVPESRVEFKQKPVIFFALILFTRHLCIFKIGIYSTETFIAYIYWTKRCRT